MTSIHGAAMHVVLLHAHHWLVHHATVVIMILIWVECVMHHLVAHMMIITHIIVIHTTVHSHFSSIHTVLLHTTHLVHRIDPIVVHTAIHVIHHPIAHASKVTGTVAGSLTLIASMHV